MQIASARPEKRTNVRLDLLAMQATFRTLGATSPALAARLAARFFGRPPRAPQREEHRAVLGKARRIEADTGGIPLAVYGWGSGPTILLVHGWGGHAGQLTPLVEPLVAAGRQVIAFDAPAHGATPGTATDLPQFARAIDAVVQRVGGISGLAAHSMGAAAVAHAMHALDLQAGRAVFLAPSSDLLAASRRFAQLLAIPPSVLERMQRRFEEQIGIRWDRLSVPAIAASMQAKLLVVHDEGDREVPLEEGEAIAAAWPGAVLERTRGLGHHRILRDPAVVERAVSFLA